MRAKRFLGPGEASDEADDDGAPAGDAGDGGEGVGVAAGPADAATADEAAGGAVSDAFDDLYSSNAPKDSIAAGMDFGRLAALRELGIATDVSTLERLVLAEVRCHHVVYKVVAYGEETERQRLHGHSIVAPQKAERVGGRDEPFGMAAMRAAFAAVRIVFVGPNGTQTKLERAALKIRDLRLRPEVIFNFLTIRHELHGGQPPPTLEDVRALVDEHGGLAAHIADHARHTDQAAGAVERATAPSDVAGVRATAQSRARASLEEDVEATAAAADEALEPSMDPVGLLEMPEQEMDAVVRGIERIVREGGVSQGRVDDGANGGDGGDGGDGRDEAGENSGGGGGSDDANARGDGSTNGDGGDDAGEGGGAAAGGETGEGGGARGEDAGEGGGAAAEGGDALEFRRSDVLLDDYQGMAEALYGAWWPLLPLRRGFRPGQIIPENRWRQVFLYYDNRFAQDLALLFHVANVKMRHAVNRAVGARVKSSAKGDVDPHKHTPPPLE